MDLRLLIGQGFDLTGSGPDSVDGDEVLLPASPVLSQQENARLIDDRAELVRSRQVNVAKVRSLSISSDEESKVRDEDAVDQAPVFQQPS
jgi:hypothetical protein